MGKVYNNIISTAAGFQYRAQQPLDDREVVQSYSDLADLETYEGMEVYVVDDKQSYKLIGTEWQGVITADKIGASLTDTVKYVPQTLTMKQQEQARANIGVAYPISQGEESNSLQQDSNQALSPNAFALGLNSIAGGYGFHVVAAVDNGNKTGTYTIGESSSGNTSNTSAQLQALADLVKKGTVEYSSVLKYANYKGGKITAVNVANQTITVNGYKHFDLNPNSDAPENFNVYNFITIYGHPELGNKQVGFNAYAHGRTSQATNLNAVALGENANAIGKNSLAIGKNAIAAHSAGALGESCQALGNNSMAIGLGAKARNERSVAIGSRTQALQADNIVLGAYNIPDTERINENDPYKGKGQNLLIVGNGLDGANLSNALTLDWEGRLWAARDLVIGGTGVSTGESVLHAFNNIRALQERITTLEEIIYGENGSPGLTYEISDDGTYAVCTGIGTSKSLLISIAPTYQNLPVIAIDEEAFAGNTNIISLILPEGLTTIGNAAFKGCTNLSTIRLPSTLAFMGDYAFYGCSSLKTLELAGSALGQYAFAYCTSLTDITRNENCQITTIPQYAFDHCTSLINVDFTGLTSIEPYAFSYCSFENGLTIPANIKTVGSNAFRNIKAPVIIANCQELRGSAFNSSSNLTVIYLNCQTIWNAIIDWCSKCTTVYMTKPYNTLSIHSSAFKDANSLTDVYVTWGEGEVANAPWDTTVPKFTVHYNCDTVIEGVKYTKHSTYYSCDGLADTSKTSITIVDQIGATPVEEIVNSAFYDCPITEVTLGSNIKRVTGAAFAHCWNLGSVYLNEKLEHISYEAFMACRALTYITIPESVTYIGDLAFSGTSLEGAKFINPYNWNVTSSYDEHDTQLLYSSELKQDNIAAEYLKTTYSDYNWERN